MSVNDQTVPEALDADQKRLHELGYAQELRRRMSGFSNFAVSFTIISILSGCLTLYGFGMNTGGPAVIVWGWPFVGIMTLFVGLAMAEVCSSYPTAGGLYYWAAKIAPKNGAAWSWFTGWFNFLGQVAVIGLQFADQRTHQLAVPLIMVIDRLFDLNQDAVQFLVADLEHAPLPPAIIAPAS